MRTRRITAVVLVALVVLAAACSSSGSDAVGSSDTTAPAIGRAAPTGPSATFRPLTGGSGVFLGASRPVGDLASVGYAETEYAASGTAVSYTSAGDLPADGRFQLQPGPGADYATRVLVRRPTDPARFNGTVVVEWLNVSGGVDAAPDYTYLSDELLRGGYAWVGVSAQRIGVEGGPVLVKVPGGENSGAGKGLRAIDSARYGQLHHPGDAFSYDIFTQVGRGLLATGAGAPLAGLDVERLLAVGESQSAYALTTYVDGVQPLAHVYDGFLIHSRGGSPAPLGAPGSGIDLASSLAGAPTIIRTDLDVPVIVVETETDVLGLLDYDPARQPDSDRFRLWEIAGTAHADHVQIGDTEAVLGCSEPVNRGQQVYVLRAAIHDLDGWVADGTAPPRAPRLDIDRSTTPPTYVRDTVGNVRGGIRTPVVDAPVDVLSGLPVPGVSTICILFGSTTPIPAAQLSSLYPSRADYLAAYQQATDAAIAAGFVLPADRAAVLADADPSRIAG